jgi:hypothetical protein
VRNSNYKKQKKTRPIRHQARLFFNRTGSLNDGDVYRCWSFRSLLDVKGNPVTFLQSFESCPVDAGMMHEYIRTILLFDKTITLAFIKPFYNTIGHCGTLLQ